jgi:hypothetical protein
MAKVRINGDTSGYIELASPGAAGSNTLTLPSSNGSANQLLKNSGTAGTLAWSTLTEDSSGNLSVDSGTLYVDASNNRVGIGTTSPGRTLTVQNSSTVVTAALVSNPANIAYLLFGDTDSDAQGRVQYDNSSDTLQLYSNGNERLRIDNSGRLGVGSTLSGGAAYNRLVVTSPDASCWISLQSSATGSVINSDGLEIGLNGSNQGHIWLRENADLLFAANNTERMRLTGATGRLLIGTSSDPGYQLTVVGANSYALLVRQDVGDWTYPVTTFHSNFTTGNNILTNYYTDASSLRGSVDYNRSAGQIRYNITSDRRLKSNIEDAVDATNLLSQIKVRSYIWKETGYKVNHGFIAQELNSVVPDAVKVGDDGEEITDTWAVDNGKLVPVLTAALQESIQRIEQLETLNASFEARLAALEVKP